VTEPDGLTKSFEESRSHLRAVAYRMLGSLSEAEDAVQEAWLRLSRADTSEVENLRGWLTTVVARVCLDQLRARKTRHEESLTRVPDPIVSRDDAVGPDDEIILADSIGLALQVVLETLAPPERLAFVLHDMFAVPFEEIAPIVGRTPTAARQLASRARRRVQGTPTASDCDVGRQREVVEAFLTASRSGNFEALVAVLDPEVVLRADAGADLPGGLRYVRGAETVARQAILYGKTAPPDRVERMVLVNGGVGIVAFAGGKPRSVLGFTVVGGKVAAMDILADRERLAELHLEEVVLEKK
jgi:RNA polymerase sigma-70 factor (ECF subfamily)